MFYYYFSMWTIGAFVFGGLSVLMFRRQEYCKSPRGLKPFTSAGDIIAVYFFWPVFIILTLIWEIYFLLAPVRFTGGPRH